MDVINGLKKLFPKPRIPQKRYIMLAGFVVFALLKVYVAFTPDPSDDDLPDKLRVMFFDVMAEENSFDQNGISTAGTEAAHS